MSKWTTELKSGEFKQAKGVLFDGEGYCCLGVREKLEGVEFTETSAGWWIDAHGMSVMPLTSVIDRWGLHDALMQEEWDEVITFVGKITKSEVKRNQIADAYKNAGDSQYNPADVLATMNDNGFTFKQIAMVIEKFGWEK